MDVLPNDVRLVRRVYWLINLRWIAVVVTTIVVSLACLLWHAVHAPGPLYGIVMLLTCENIVSLVSLKWIVRRDLHNMGVWIRRLIHFQIAADLVLLTALLHFSGGVENPLVVCFVFHMVIASILLSVRESYVQAAFAVSLLVMLGFFEYRGIWAHYCLDGLLTHGFHAQGYYVMSTVGVLAGTLLIVVYMTTDISTQLRRRERAYRLANQELHQKDRIKNEYVARVTHDIKGHLAAIQSCQDVVSQELVGPLTAGQQDLINRANVRTAHLIKFVKTLLKLTEMRLSHRMDMAWFSINETITQAMATCQSRALDKSITLTHRIECPALEVHGHQVSIEETLTNLVLNAIKYTPEHGTVEVVARYQGGEVCVDIRDTGIGIPPEELPCIFKEFYRASNARALEKDGTGLGLAIVKQIVERHGGRLGARNRDRGGSEFSLALPVKPKQPTWNHGTEGQSVIQEMTPKAKERDRREIY
ncbi:MAG: HAMP domain-containing histidine kinase [Phycisphaerae bacterium]|nr:HAMP domain-containing histidine kinase [Phycisphaerae bacterium]